MAEKQLSLDFVSLPDKLEVKSKEIVRVFTYVVLEGQEFELNDLFDTLDEISAWPSQTYVEDDRMEKMLKHFRVITSNSKHYGINTGHNFKKFYDMVKEVKNG